MNQESVIADIEARARAAGVSMGSVCRRAKINPTTFCRWKPSLRNPEPMGATLHSIGKLYHALEAIEAEQRAPRLSRGVKQTSGRRRAAA